MSSPIIKSAIAGLAGLSANSAPDGDYSARNILDSLPAHIRSLDRKGIWCVEAPGASDYFKSIQSDNFVQWVNLAVHVQDRVGVLKAVSDCRAENGETLAEFRLIVQYGDTNHRQVPQWVELRCTPLPAEESILTILRDISDRKLLEREILEARDQADQANVAKTRFLANMSHELRTPLNAIIGFSEILKSGMVPVEEVKKQREYQGLIHTSAQHLLQVLNDILDMSKIEAGKYELFPEEINLGQIIRSCCSMMLPLAQKEGVTLNFPEPIIPLTLEADSTAIRQVLINLISNAVKFTRPHSTVEISAHRTGRKIEIKISDKGMGISAEGLNGLGEPFYQVDGDKSRRHEGTGLGLSIVKGLIQLHGGKFTIESVVGIGTTATVQLPYVLSANNPVPADDRETAIRIRTLPASAAADKLKLSRLAG